MNACPDLLACPRSAALVLILLGLTAPMAAEAQETAAPWAVESPGAAGARFGLGLDAFFERQESLRATGAELTFRSETQEIAPDPLNRDFDFRVDLRAAGLQLPVALPRLGVIHPTLVLQAAMADVTFDFLDQTQEQGQESRGGFSYEGRGPLFGGGLELTSALCRRCPWFAGAGYRFQRLHDLEVDVEGGGVVDDEARLSRDVHEVSARVGYGSPGGRIVSYLGVRHRSTGLEIEEELDTRAFRAELESDATLALAGVEAHLGGSFYGRAEATYGDEDYSALLKVVYLGPGKGPAISWPGRGGETGQVRETEEERRRREQRIEEIGGTLALRLAAIEAAFLAGWRSLEVIQGPDGQPAYIARDVEELLARTEREILSVLGELPELEALRDWVRDEFRAVGTDLGLETPNVAARVASVTFTNEFRRTQARETINKSRADAGLQRAATGPVGTPPRLARDRRLMVPLTFQTTLGKGTQLRIHPRFSSSRAQILERGGLQWVWVGSYSYKVQRGNEDRLYCEARTPEGTAPCPLNLLLNPCRTFACDEEECTCR